jgi:hypothetical protein
MQNTVYTAQAGLSIAASIIFLAFEIKKLRRFEFRVLRNRLRARCEMPKSIGTGVRLLSIGYPLNLCYNYENNTAQ